jgi:pimeloyl-ACP methyl ester carboxylesterase
MSTRISEHYPANRITERITKPDGVTVSYDRFGEGPPLVLVHGSFSDHVTNWQEVTYLLKDRFTVYSVARRGRGETSATHNHTINDEMSDVASVLDAVGEPAFLLGHSYGAVCALGAAGLRAAAVRKLVLYEHPTASMFTAPLVARLEKFAESEDWNRVVQTFMLDALQVPPGEVEMIRSTPFWNVWTSDAKATVNDLRAIVKHEFDVKRFRSLDVPVLLLIGTESPRDNYLTDTLNAVLPNATIVALEGQAHEGMTTAPEQFVDAISKFLLK